MGVANDGVGEALLCAELVADVLVGNPSERCDEVDTPVEDAGFGDGVADREVLLSEKGVGYDLKMTRI